MSRYLPSPIKLTKSGPGGPKATRPRTCRGSGPLRCATTWCAPRPARLLGFACPTRHARRRAFRRPVIPACPRRPARLERAALPAAANSFQNGNSSSGCHGFPQQRRTSPGVEVPWTSHRTKPRQSSRTAGSIAQDMPTLLPLRGRVAALVAYCASATHGTASGRHTTGARASIGIGEPLPPVRAGPGPWTEVGGGLPNRWRSGRYPDGCSDVREAYGGVPISPPGRGSRSRGRLICSLVAVEGPAVRHFPEYSETARTSGEIRAVHRGPHKTLTGFPVNGVRVLPQIQR